MSNTFLAHIFKKRQVGERQEVAIKLFNRDGSPLELGETPDLSSAVLAAWKGDFNASIDYPAGSLVRYNNKTYLAHTSAPASAPDPGVSVGVSPVVVNGGPREAAGYNLPRDVVATLAGLTGYSGYNMGGMPRWFRMFGTPGETVTVSAEGSNLTNAFHFYGPDGDNTFMGGGNYAAPKTVVIPAAGFFGVEVDPTLTSIKYVGPNGPQPVPGNPWVQFS